MSNGRKILLLCWTLWPLFYFFLFFAVVVGFAATSIYREQTSARAAKPAVAAAPPTPDAPPPAEAVAEPEAAGFPLFAIPLIVVHFLTMLNQLALLAYYIYHLYKKNQVLTKDNDKLIWLLLILFFNMFCMPVYWYLYIWKPRPLPGAVG